MMRVSPPAKQLDKGTNKGQWRKVYEADCGAPDAGSAPYLALDLDRITSPLPKNRTAFRRESPCELH
jgi:hypothetical protein